MGEDCVHAQLVNTLLLMRPESLLPSQNKLSFAFFPSEIRFHILPSHFFKMYFSIVLLPPQLLSNSLLPARLLTKILDGLSSFQRLFHVPSYSVSLISLYLKVGVHFFVIKPTTYTNFINLFWHETLHVSDSSSVHHQEFIHCTLSNGICHTGL